MYAYIKALHIIFIVTWFAGLFYMPRLFIYNTEAGEKPEAARIVLREQFALMMKRLWYGITWPSAILTFILGTTVLLQGGWDKIILLPAGKWLLIKLVFVVFLYAYQFTINKIFYEQLNGLFKYSSQQLRIWNEVATVFLIAIVMLATVKESMSFVWGLVGLVMFIALLMSAIRIYKMVREKK
jgi:protoporphyrinogen IX oxidase